MSLSPPGSVDAQFSCSICGQLLKDPVTVPCGHSYCMCCLRDYWDGSSGAACSCPQCRATFSPRPALGRNTLMAQMLERFGTASLSNGPSAPPPPPYHQMTGLSAERGFEHAVFDVSSFHLERNDEARLSGITRRQLAHLITEKESELQQMKLTLKSFTHLAKAAAKDSGRIFSDLLEFLERCRSKTKALIRDHEKAEVTRGEGQMRRLEQEISELRRREAALEKHPHAQDPGPIEQMCETYGSTDSPREANFLAINSNISFGPVRNAISDLKEQIQSLWQKEFSNIARVVKNVELLRVARPKPLPATHDHHSIVDNREELLRCSCPLSLDPFTAHKELLLTEGNRMVRRDGGIQPYPDHPDRFDSWGQALCREGLDGRSYWEAVWEGQQVALGVAYASISRKGSSNECGLGNNSVSWSLRCSESSLMYCHDNEARLVMADPSAKSQRIGVYLDHGAGVLCFYTVTSDGVHLLHKVETTFRAPLHPAVWLGALSSIVFCSNC